MKLCVNNSFLKLFTDDEKAFFPFYLCVFMRSNDSAYTLSAKTLPRLNMTFTLIWSRRNGEQGGGRLRGVSFMNTIHGHSDTKRCCALLPTFRILRYFKIYCKLVFTVLSGEDKPKSEEETKEGKKLNGTEHRK